MNHPTIHDKICALAVTIEKEHGIRITNLDIFWRDNSSLGERRFDVEKVTMVTQSS